MPTPGNLLISSHLRGDARSIADAGLLAAFVETARTAGDRIALVEGTQSLTYAELHHRTNQWAHALQARGVGPGVLVGIALARSADLVIALLAVVKAGGAYVPLDPDYPEARLAAMLARARPRVVLTHERFASRLRSKNDAVILAMDAAESSIAGESSADPPVTAGAEDPLYVIFTSGSTGPPKGAVVRRGGFANLVEWFGEEFAIGPEDRFLLLTSPSFDLTQKNFFAPLRAGGTLVCLPPGPFDLERVADLIERHGITVMNCTPSAFYPLVEATDGRALRRIASLRLVVLGGEPIAIPRIRPWLEHPDCRAEIANTYGPTECTDICAFHRLHRGNLDAFPVVPLGRTIPNVQLAVLDESLRPRPDGEEGELVIGGAGVGPGYLGDAARTAERFVPNPCPDLLDGPTAYRTGDRVRVLPGGLLEFLGRIDHQVKLRGFRIELPEIESALAGHPAVREAAVILCATSCEPELVAFLIAAAPAVPVGAAALRDFLAARLPEYMLPSRTVWLDRFPLTPNGKVDRLQLAAPPADAPAAAIPPPAPEEGWEASLHAIWADVLAERMGGLDDNFFDLGGNSIQLASIHARITARAGKPVPITDLFAHPTVRSLARHLTTGDTPVGESRRRAEKQRQALRQRRAAGSRP